MISAAAGHAAGSIEALRLHGRLASTDTSISVEADEHAPRLRSLQLPGAMPWINRSPETLPAQIVVDGVAHGVVWRLDRAASHFTAREIRLRYLADAPRLELLWIWRARARQGPLEHSIQLRNLSDLPVLLPLQPSFRFDWQIDATAALQKFWVEIRC